jgi:hypothetical protein
MSGGTPTHAIKRFGTAATSNDGYLQRWKDAKATNKFENEERERAPTICERSEISADEMHDPFPHRLPRAGVDTIRSSPSILICLLPKLKVSNAVSCRAIPSSFGTYYY